VLVLIERRDEATARAVRDVDPPDYVRIVELPPGRPQTKPRSCNLGLMLARGDLLVIFDAEDRPERDQLRKAASQFAAGGPGLACVQARLNFYNARRNVLTRMFALEFGYWFDLMLVGLDRLGLPIPLGGTSNHLRTDVLRDIGGWDAWNVTEDADIGIRLAAAGYRVEVVDSTTWEECPPRAWAWTRQRTRWLKGYLLTLLVHTRSPVAATRRFGAAGMVTLLALVGGTPVGAMLWPLAFVLPFAGALPDDLGRPAVASAYVASGAMWVVVGLTALAMMVAGRRRGSGWALAALLPWYLLMHAVAAWRGLWQLVGDPYGWEKTSHNAAATAR
jgi:cellulose synthase/poly-beta-1,6-N-acetylglucosamine synthase-like glycosyltransferase